MPPLDLSPSLFSFSPYSAASILTFLLAVLVGLLVYRKDPASPAYRMWLLLSLAVAGWAFGLAIACSVSSKPLALWGYRLADTVALLIPVTYLHFVMQYVGQIRRVVLQVSYATILLLATTFWTPFFVSDVNRKFGIWYEVSGPGMLAFLALFILLPAYGVLLLNRALHCATGTKRAQLKLLIVASVLGFSSGLMWFLPGFEINIPPIGGLFVSLYCIVIIYSVLKYRWMDVQIVIRKSLVYSILVTMLTVGYFGLVYGIERICRTTFGYQSLWVSLMAFALMAVTFQPLKVGIQRLVDLVIFRVPQEELVRRMERLEKEAFQAEKLRVISTMAAGMAHEIKNPLTSIQTFAEFIPEKQKDPEFLKKLHEVLSFETRRIQGIVQEVLDFAKPKAPQLKPVDLGPLISSTVDLLSSELLKRHIKWQVDCQHNGATLHADQNQLRQVLINLIQNAADAMPEGGSLTIATRTSDSHLNLAISDTGQGIPKEALAKIFDPFFTTKENGTGLGLAMVHSIIQAHHGTIHADSTPGAGTTFTVSLPI